jgi:hypothetical protein
MNFYRDYYEADRRIIKLNEFLLFENNEERRRRIYKELMNEKNKRKVAHLKIKEGLNV